MTSKKAKSTKGLGWLGHDPDEDRIVAERHGKVFYVKIYKKWRKSYDSERYDLYICFDPGFKFVG